MSRMHNKTVQFFVVLFLLLVAYIPNLLWWMFEYPLPPTISNLSFIITLVLFFVWGITIRNRIIHPRIRGLLIAISYLIIFWLVIRTIKYKLVADIDTERFLWYLYYIPLIFIPTLSFLVSLNIGMIEYSKGPKIVYLIGSIALILVLIVLSNDYHQLVFRFKDNLENVCRLYHYQNPYSTFKRENWS